MKRVRKFITVIMILIMSLSINIWNGTEAGSLVYADTVFAITSPSNNELSAAGYIDIKWNSVSNSSGVKKYKVYVDGSLVATTTSTKYEFYTTKVNYHTAWIEAELNNGKKLYTPTVKFGVTKKGLGLSANMGAYVNLKSMKCGWYYNWANVPSTGEQYKGVEFVPMLWKETNANIIKTKLNNFVAQGYKYCLAFNEPDLKNQCNMSMESVFNLWPAMMNDQIKISSPVTALWPESSKNWFQPFMIKINANANLDVDFISIHCYPDNWNGGKSMADWFLKTVVDWTWEKYHKPIWVTEFSTAGQGITNGGTESFIEYVLPGLDERDYVERYAFFSFNRGSFPGGLWWYSNGALSPAGEMYMKKGNPTTEYKTGNAVNPYKPSSTTNVTKITKPAKVKIKSVKNLKGRKIKLSLKKVKGAVGYQVKIADNKKFNGYWNKNIKKTSYTFKKLDKNTRYYFKVRAYVKNGRKKLYGAWSKAKNVKVKK